MTAALRRQPNYEVEQLVHTAQLEIPDELAPLLAESPTMRASFWGLEESDRRGFVRYITEAKSTPTRERRAAIVAMSLMALARDLTKAVAVAR